MEPAEHEADHSEVDPGFGALRIGLIVPGQLAMPHEPGEGSLHNPSPGQHDKTPSGLSAWARSRPSSRGSVPPREPDSRIGTVGPQVLHTREAAFAHLPDDTSGSLPVLHACGVDDHREDQAQGIDADVPISPGNQLTCIDAPAAPLFPAVRTDWLSTMQALGVGSLPARMRTCSRSASWICSSVPFFFQRRK